MQPMKSHPAPPAPPAPDANLREWLAGELHRLTGEQEFQSSALRAQASFRQFYRITTGQAGKATFVVMASPPELEHNDRFASIANVFHRAKVGVPKIIAQDATQGWFLMTDLGERDLESAYTGADKDRAVAAAIETLIRIQSIDHDAITPYTAERCAM